MSKRRRFVIPVRLNAAELASVEEQATAAAVDRSAFIRWKLCGSPLPAKQDPTTKGAEVWEQVSRLLNNTQQIGRFVLDLDRPAFLKAATWLDTHYTRGLREGVALEGVNLRELRAIGRKLNRIAADVNSKRTATEGEAQAAYDLAAEAADLLRPALVQLGWITNGQAEG